MWIFFPWQHFSLQKGFCCRCSNMSSSLQIHKFHAKYLISSDLILGIYSGWSCRIWLDFSWSASMKLTSVNFESFSHEMLSPKNGETSLSNKSLKHPIFFTQTKCKITQCNHQQTFTTVAGDNCPQRSHKPQSDSMFRTFFFENANLAN